MNNRYLLHDKLLLSYTVADGDRYQCEVAVRNVYLLDHPMQGLIIRGEMPDCGPESDATLGQILLEYALTCQGCEPAAMKESMTHFGRQLGTLLADKLLVIESGMSDIERLEYAIHLLLVSMEVPFERERMPDTLHYRLACCPFEDIAWKINLTGNVALALRGFVALLDSLVSHLAPEWRVEKPSGPETTEPLLEIAVVQR